MKAPQEQKKGLDAGVYDAVCYSVIDMGTKENPYEQGKKRHNLTLGWKLLEHTYSDGNPLKVHKTVTFSMNEKATLRKWITAWFAGQNVNFDDFDFRTLINKGCKLVVSPSQSGKNVVTNVMPHETATTFDDVELFSLEGYAGEPLPNFDEWKLNSIKESDEYKRATGGAVNETPAGVILEDDVPF